MFCFDKHKDLVKIYNYIKGNKKCINDKVKMLNLDTSREYITNLVYNYDFRPIQHKLTVVYKNLNKNNKVPKEIVEYLSVFISIKFPDTMVDFIYSFINDKKFYKNILFIFKTLSDITKCISITNDKLSRKDMDKIIKFYNHDISKIKKVLNVSTYNLLIMMSNLYPEPLRTLKIKIGKINPKYEQGGKSLNIEFKNKFPKANLRKLSNEDKLGVMYYVMM